MTNIATPPISAGELAQLQADMNSLMEQSIAIWRRSISQGPTGNVIESYALNSTVKGTLSQPTAGMLANYDYLVGSLAAWAVRVPVGTSIQATDHLIVSGQTLEVQIVLAPQSYQGAIRVLATEVK